MVELAQSMIVAPEGHLMREFAQEGRKSMVIGHRGGFFGPENSIRGFQGAVDNNLEGIEFDVSASGGCAVLSLTRGLLCMCFRCG